VRHPNISRQQAVLLLGLVSLFGAMRAQVTVVGRVEVTGVPASRRTLVPNTVVWLTPLSGSATGMPATPPRDPAKANDPDFRLIQKNKSFEPHLLVVPVGSVVEFPNHDPFFHNVFSLFEGKRFDLGLYEAGSTRIVHFDRPGVSYIFCNIHPEMSAVIVTVNTPWYAISSPLGQLSIANVPHGRYLMHIWSEQRNADNAEPETKEITISEETPSLGVIRVRAVNGEVLAHKNKYGRDYDQPTPDSPVYH